jgi:hypothetical protein
MEDLVLNKEFDTQTLITELFKQNLFLQGQVKTLYGMISDVYERSIGLSPEKTREIFQKASEEHFQEIIEENEWFSDMWKEKFKNEMGDIPGIKI